jgi:penicillin amidase
MRNARRTLAPSSVALLLALAACSSSSNPATPVDGGTHDSSAKDAKATDGKAADAKAHDAVAEVGQFDAGAVNAIPVTQTLTAPVLSAPVDVVRDAYGIPHIYGATLPDVAYAEGYVMAADRFMEMDLGRREGAGTLTEIVGGLDPAVLATDIGMRMHHLTATATTTWQQLQASTDPKDQTLVQAITLYADGINAWEADLAAGRGSLPSQVAGLYGTKSITPWSPIDSFVLSYLQAFELVYDSDTEITFTQILAAGTSIFDNATNPDLLARKGIGKDFEILSPEDPTYTLPSGWTGMDGDTSEAKAGPMRTKHGARAGGKPGVKLPSGVLATTKTVTKSTTRELLALLSGDAKAMRGIGNDRMVYPTRGSNNFILGPGLTADGNVIIGNDTHLSLSNPPIFYLVQLVATGGNVPVNAMGVNFPGIPGIVLGNNEHVAWAATDNYIDVTDVYQETVVNCADSTPYAGTGSPCVVFNGANVPATPRVEKFKIGYNGTFSSTVSETFYDVAQHGPIVPRLDANNNVLPLGSSELSIKYTGYQPARLHRHDDAGSGRGPRQGLPRRRRELAHRRRSGELRLDAGVHRAAPRGGARAVARPSG